MKKKVLSTTIFIASIFRCFILSCAEVIGLIFRYRISIDAIY